MLIPSATARALLIATLVTITIATAHAADPKQLLEHGDFEAVDAQGNATGWGLAPGITVTSDPLNHFLRFQAAGPAKAVTLYRQVPLSGAKAIAVTCRVRYAGVERGAEGWHDARIIMNFKNDKNDNVGGDPSHPFFTGTSDAWQPVKVVCAVPASATSLAIMPGMWQAKAGTLDIDDLSVTAIDPASLPKKDDAPTASVVIDAGRAHPKMLKTDGPRLIDSDGKDVWLQGVNVPSLEWSDGGESLLQSIVVAIDDWKANIIRLPVSGERWAKGEPYRALVDQCVLAASSRGAYLLLDLHGYRAPSDADIAFWVSAAARYKDQPGVIYGLLNEPFGTSWEIWKNGGEITDKKSDAPGNDQQTVSHTSPGLQKVADAVRGTGAHNVMVIGGLDWAYDLSGVIAGSAIEDHGGNGIIYDSHVYYWKSGWQHSFLDIAAKYPVILGEVGCDIKNLSFIPPERFENPYTWAPDMLACIQKNHVHWTGWSFHPGASPAMLQDMKTYAPTPYWGSFAKAALLGAHFESTKLR